MGFTSAAAYDRFMGRWSAPLTLEFLSWLDLSPASRVLDVGCGPGALTAAAVAACDPSEAFVAAARERHPEVDVRRAVAEDLPWPDDSFDAALAQLVVHFMTDPVAGLREMARVCRPGGVVAASVWDHADGGGPLSGYWAAVRELDPDARDEADMTGARSGDLVRLAHEAGLAEVTGGVLTVTCTFATFEEWWTPYTLGVGPAGEYVQGLDDTARERLEDRCRAMFPTEPFSIRASAWAVRAVSPSR